MGQESPFLMTYVCMLSMDSYYNAVFHPPSPICTKSYPLEHQYIVSFSIFCERTNYYENFQLENGPTVYGDC